MGAIDSMNSAVAEHRRLKALASQYAALLAEPNDLIDFACANPPYKDLLRVQLPRSVWGPIVQKNLDDVAIAIASFDAAAVTYVGVKSPTATAEPIPLKQ